MTLIRRLWLIAPLAVMAVGCEAKTKFDPNIKFSEEQKQKSKMEDQAVADEESYGSAGKAKVKKK